MESTGGKSKKGAAGRKAGGPKKKAVSRSVKAGLHRGACRRNGLQQRRNSWQDGVSGTNCPIPPGKNFTYMIQAKDQIGSFFYYPSLGMHKAAGGFGGISIYSRPRIPVPFPPRASMVSAGVNDTLVQ